MGIAACGLYNNPIAMEQKYPLAVCLHQLLICVYIHPHLITQNRVRRNRSPTPSIYFVNKATDSSGPSSLSPPSHSPFPLTEGNSSHFN